MEGAMSDQQRQLISSFLEIAIGQPVDIAIQFLQATCWRLEEAVNLFLIGNPNQAISNHQEEQIRPPLPSMMDTLYDPSMNHTSRTVSLDEMWDSAPGTSDSVRSNSRLSSLYRLPQNLLFTGSFEDAKYTSSREDLWLLVNLQSTTEFASHTLNRDLWSNDAVSQVIRSSLILWQTYDHTDEGQKITSFYKIESAPPVVLLIDPITGQKMRMWNGVIEAQSFVEDLTKFIDVGPHEHIASLTGNKRIKTEKSTCSSGNESDQDMATFFDHDFEDSSEGKSVTSSETCSSSDHIVAPSWGQECEESSAVKEDKNIFEFPVLTEEPKGDWDRNLVCSLCLRFPDGKRKLRKFLKTEPIQFLWSLCYSHMEEYEKKAFKLIQAIPGASKTLDYGASLTFDQSGLANSIISVIWE